MKPNKTDVLLVEDNPVEARLIIELLSEHFTGNYTFKHVDRISAAMKSIGEKKFDVILLDLTLPDGNGLETVERICTVSSQMPVIVLSGLEDDALALAAVQTGAQDFLVKGQVDSSGLSRAIRYAMERKKSEEKMHYLATHDTLTDLPNRRLFQDRIEHGIERGRRNRRGTSKKWELALLLLDLDNFKIVNDSLGHSTGDLLLKAVADRLKNTIRKTDTLARMGGDEFTLIFENVHGKEDADLLAKKILALFSQPFELGNKTLSITASIGVSLYPCDSEEAESLLKYADIAMYRAKRERNTVSFYHEGKDK